MNNAGQLRLNPADSVQRSGDKTEVCERHLILGQIFRLHCVSLKMTMKQTRPLEYLDSTELVEVGVGRKTAG